MISAAIAVPSLGSMLTVIGVALLATVVLSALAGALFLPRRGHDAPTGGTAAPRATEPQPRPAPAVPGPRADTSHDTREHAGV